MIFVGPTRNFMICVFNALVAGNIAFYIVTVFYKILSAGSPKNFLLPEVSCQFERWVK